MHNWANAELALLVIHQFYSAVLFLIMKSLPLRKLKLKYAGISGISLITCALLLLSSMAIGHTQDLDGSTEGTIGWKSYGLVGDVAYAPGRLDGRHRFQSPPHE